jgi:hypothetical protein
LYTDVASRTADSGRSQTQDPGVNSGVVAEVITSGANAVVIAPAAVGFNMENPVTTAIPCAVTNLSGNTAAITVTVTILQTEL